MDSDIDVNLTRALGGLQTRWSAKLARVEGMVDEESRMHYVVARIADPYSLKDLNDFVPLKAGSFVQAQLVGGEVAGLLRIPRNVIYGDGLVLVIDENNSLRYRKITPVYSDENTVYVAQNEERGLKAGEELCLTPLTNPVEGMVVRRIGSDRKSADTDNPIGNKG